MAKYKIKKGVGIIPEDTIKIEECAFYGCVHFYHVVNLQNCYELEKKAKTILHLKKRLL